jgi:beta-lactamase class A
MHTLKLWLIISAMTLTSAATQAQTLAGLDRSQRSGDLQLLVDQAVGGVLSTNWATPLTTNQIAVTLVDLADPEHPRWASYRGNVRIYPASTIKLFYLVAAHRWLEDGKLQDGDELRRAMRDMIVESYNEATHLIVDLLTDTTSGPELAPDSLRTWYDKRNAVNRYFESVGYAGINANKKPWCEGPYGREMQATKAFEPRRNMLTTDTTARILTEIVLGRAVTADRCKQMMALLSRDPSAPSTDPDDQSHGFTALAIQPGMKLWSKAGWTSEVRHDAAYIELPNHRKIVLVTFTTDHANERGIIPAVAKSIFTAIEGK